jgi:peptide/nickel transport system permease protein
VAHVVLRRLLQTVPVLWGVSTAVFAMLHLVPGDPVAVMLQQSGGDAATMERLRHQLGLDLPLWQQYLTFMGNAVRGDFGNSIFQNRPVIRIIGEQFPSTLELTASAMLVAGLIGLPIGCIAAVRRGSLVDRLSLLLASVGVAMPVFWLAMLAIFYFSFTLGWFPATGQGGPERLVLPAVVLGLGSAAAIARLIRSSLLDVLRQDYVRTAHAKGLGSVAVTLRHALRNALIPAITVMALQVGTLMGGTVVTETIFSRQGLGRLAVESILAKDFPVVQGTVLLGAVVYILVNLLVDLSYALIDPRIRRAQAT